MRTIKAISLLTAAVMGCTALLAGCEKGSDSSSSKAEEGVSSFPYTDRERSSLRDLAEY